MTVIIGISANIMIEQGDMFPGYERCYVNQDYIHSVIKNGGIPLVIPMNEDDSVIDAQMQLIDGLLLTGGQDVTPSLYEEDPQEKLGETLLRRDLFDYALIKKAKEREIPILGICRGAQILNVYHGGSLFQDVSYRLVQTIRHWQSHNPTEKTHEVRVFPNNHLAEIFTEGRFFVNSFHHQVINKIAEDFVVTAQSNDGAIEAFESTTYDYMLGIQWHPEMLWRESSMDALFTDFINHSRK